MRLALVAALVLAMSGVCSAAAPVVISGPVQVHGSGAEDTGIALVPAIDLPTHALIVMHFVEHELRSGHYFYSDTFATLTSGDSLVVVVQTADTDAHVTLAPGFRTSGEANIVILEGVSFAGGDVLPVYNRNRNSSDTAAAIRIQQPTITDRGVQLAQEHFGAGNRTGGNGDEAIGWIMKPNTNYAVILTSEAAGNDCYLSINSYKHTDLEVVP